MLRSLFSGISGLRQHQTMMDVVGNNIANVNTIGFKSSAVVFEDTLSQTVRAASAPTVGGVGGLNPAQIGLGVQLGGISTNFGQGSAQTTNKSTDVMIQGDGFFVLSNGVEQLYSRAGAFTFDTNGYLVNDQGMYVQGYPASDGVVDTNAAVGNIRIPVGTMIPPAVSTSVTIAGNIDSSSTNNLTLGATAYDAKGTAHPLTITLTYDSSLPGYTIDVTDTSDGTTGTTGDITWPAAGAPATVNPADITLADGTVVTMDLNAVTNYGGSQSLNVSATDGYPTGTLQQFKIEAAGTIVGVFSNGQKLNMAQIALANFNNPAGLEKIGNTSFRSTPNSGLAMVGTPSTGGRGQLLSGANEMSNVDLGQEFTNLIIAQRGFQANSRVITSSDEMLQDLVNIKR